MRTIAITFLIVTFAFSAPKSKVNDPIYYYPTKVGDTLVYSSSLDGVKATNDLTLTVSKIEVKAASLIVFVDSVARNNSPWLKVEVSVEGLKLLWESGAQRHPSGQWLNLNAKAGETWAAEHRVGDEKGKITYTMGKVEEVEVPAGKFSALRVDSEITGLDVNIRLTHWYAQGVGLVKSVSKIGKSEKVTVLKSFTPAK